MHTFQEWASTEKVQDFVAELTVSNNNLPP